MKNLKRVLSLGLASVMLLGMMVMGASAATFTDAADIKNDVAVNMMASLNVINGKDNGSFDPNGTVTRGEMAKMITMIMFGGEEAALTTSSTPRFTDVTNHWARKYIEYCAGKGIIAGQGDGTFAPDNNVTGTAAAKMALVALGYDAKVYNFENHRDWEININNVANSKGVTLYKGLKNIDPSQPITRDQAAQILYNALQAYVVEPTYTVTSNGIETEYNPGTDTLLVAKFDIVETEGKMTGVTYDKEKGIFTYTVGSISPEFDEDVTDLFGQEVKVIRTNDTEKKTLGIYASGDETVVTSTVGKVKDADGKKINVDGTKYEIADSVTLYKNADSAQNSESKNAAALTTAMKGAGASFDTLKLILNADGKVDTVTVINQVVSKVTNKTASKITIQNLGTLELDEHDIESDLAKGDVVVYTLTVDEKASLADARATVKSVSTIEGEVTGYNETKKTVTIDGTKYDVEGTPNLTENAITALKDIIGDDVTAYLVSGVVVALDKSTATASTSYALVTATNDNVTSSTSLSTGRVQLLLTDGTTETYDVHKDSKIQVGGTGKAVAGDLVKFSMSGDAVKIESKVADTANLDDGDKIWDDTTKQVAEVGVAANGAVIYVNVAAANKQPNWKVYNIRDLRAFEATAADTEVFHVTDDSGKVTVAAVDYKAPVYGTTNDTLWGMVLSYDGKVGIGGTEYFQYTVWTNNGEVTVNLEEKQADSFVGSLVQFDEASDKIYASADFDAVDGTSKVVAVNEYSESDRVLSYFTALEVSDGTYTGKDSSKKTVAVSKDLEVLYVNMKDKKAGEEIGINEFNSETGYANARIYEVKGIVEKIVIETSGETDVEGKTDKGNIGGTPAEPETPAHTHALTWSKGADCKAATCTAEGVKDYWTATCTGGDGCTWDATKKYDAEGSATAATGSELADVTIEALGHDFAEKADDATKHACQRAGCTVEHAADAAVGDSDGCKLGGHS